MIWVGTSGFQYPEWRGSFYPEGFPEKEMLRFYTEHFRTVEINYSFYRLPSPATLRAWVDGTPAGFKFTLKAPKWITHSARPAECELVTAFADRARELGDKLGALFFRMPDHLEKRLDLLQPLLERLPRDLRCTLDFRKASWYCEEVYDLLRAHNCALTLSDSPALATPLVPTADWLYFRLRDEGYAPEDVVRWAETVRGMARGRDAFVYFKHEAQGLGPQFGKQLVEALA